MVACSEGGCLEQMWAIQLHGSMMFLAWGLILPWGALLAQYRRWVGKAGGGEHHIGTFLKESPSFFPTHRNMQMAGVTIAAFGVLGGYLGVARIWAPCENGACHWFVPDACGDTNPGCFAPNPHSKVGIAIFLLMILQSILGIVHHSVKEKYDATSPTKPWVRPLLPSYLHVYLGHLLTMVSLFNLALGFDFYDFIYGSRVARVMVWVTLIAFLGGYVVFAIMEQVQLNKLLGSWMPLTPNAGLCPPRPTDEMSNELAES